MLDVKDSPLAATSRLRGGSGELPDSLPGAIQTLKSVWDGGVVLAATALGASFRAACAAACYGSLALPHVRRASQLVHAWLSVGWTLFLELLRAPAVAAPLSACASACGSYVLPPFAAARLNIVVDGALGIEAPAAVELELSAARPAVHRGPPSRFSGLCCY